MQTDQSLLTPGVQVWVPHPTEGFRAAEVVEPVPKKGFKVRIDEDEKPVEETHPHTDIWLRNPAILEGVDDLTKLSYMHEAAILHNLHMRYMTMQVYTYTGPILIAVNPYQRLPIYSKQMISQYCGQPLGKLSPHVYAIAEDAFRAMLTERRAQSILVSGESGAGKTETAKFLLQYFAAMGEENKGEGNVHNQVLESTPLLEAFGNAKTLRNDNSSRFGKFIGIQFDRNGNISGASIQTYLLEKSRIVRQMNGERNYHIFYQLIAGATDDEKAEYHLTSVADYHYISQSDCMEIEGVADEKVFGHTKKALTIAGIGADLQSEMWKLVSAILHLGNWKKGNDSPLQTACSLMECDFEGIKSSLTQRKVVAVREVYIVDLDDEQSEGARDALAMLLYSRLFDWLVVALNDNLQQNKKPGSSDDVFIGVLDIYGFESFDVNSFEQFCINYANEKLQQQFNQHMFKVEQQEYLKEKLDWSYINFNDNQECLDLIEKKPLGILSLLDEECRFPKSSPKSLALKLKQNHVKSKYFKSDPRQSENSFVIHHYAGSVGYDTTFFLDKNKDFLIEDQVKVLLDSKSPFVRGIFAPKPQPAAAAPAKGGRSESSAVKFVSVAAQFRDSLAELMCTIEKTSPHYVRCIKPNPQKKQGIFEKPKVLEQLRCGGVLESVRVCMAGYPGRHSYDQFYKRYRLLVPSAGSGASDAQTATKELVAALKLGEGQFQFGLTKLFLKGGEIAILERKRGEKLSDAAVMMQKTWRRFKAKQHLRRLRDSLIRMQSFVRMVLAKKLLVVLRRQRAATNIQKALRAWRARTRFAKQKKALIYVQRVFKAKREKRILRALRREKAATAIQAAIRGKLQRKRYQKAYRQVAIVQGLWRVKKAKALLEKLKRKAQALSKVVAAKAALEKKVDEMELRYAVESKMKKKVEKENARIKAEVEELKKTIKDMKVLEEKREKEKEEAAARREKEGQNKARGHERELEELKAKLREESEARAALAAELDRARSTLDHTGARADEAERQRDVAQAEVAQLRERLAEIESGDAEKDRTIAGLQRDAEKLRIRAPKKKMDGEKMERLQDRKSDYASMKSLREGHLSTSSTALVDLGGRTRSRASSTDEAAAAAGGGNQAEAERERKLRLGRSPSARDIRPRDRQRVKGKEQDKQRLEHEREKKKKEKSSTTGSPASSPSGSPMVARGGSSGPEKSAQTSPKVAKLVLPARLDIDAHVDVDSESDDDVDTEKKSGAAAEASTPADAAATTVASLPTPATAVKPVDVARPAAPERAESDYVDSRNLSEKDRERREVERGIIDRLKNKYEGKHSLVGLDNEAIMTLLPDARDVTSRNFIRFLLSELEPGFVSGVPVPAFVIYSFLCFWNLLAPQTSPRKAEGEADDTLGFILEGIYDGAKANFRENEMIIYWLSVASSLCHLVDQRLARGGSADASDASLPDELFVMDSLEDVVDDESSLSFTNKQRAEIRAGSFTAHQFKQHLRELVKRLYTILLKRVHESLEQTLNETVLGKDWTSPSPFRSGPQPRVAVKNTSSDSITALLSQYLLGLVQNFIYLSLVQKFFSQVLWFINSILFNEVLLCTQFCSTTKAMDLKVHMGNIDRWIQEEGGLWLENSQGQLAHLDQLITLLMINKKHIVSSDQMRKEVIPKLNLLQIKQVLAMYTPTDLEERISLADIQKLDRAARASSGGGDDDALLLESTKLLPLAAKELHYLELDDANSIPFPFEIKQKIHDIVEQDILKRMTVATKVQQVREKKGRFSMLLYTSRGTKKGDAPSTGAGDESTTSSLSSSPSASPTASSSPTTTTPRAAASALGAGSPGSPRGGSGLSFLQRLTEGSGMLPQRRSSSPVTHTPRELRLAQAQAQSQQQPSTPATLTAPAPAPAEDDGRKAVGLGIRRPTRGRVGGEEEGEEERERRRREQEEIERLQREIERKEREDKEAKAKAESEKEKAKASNADLGGEEIVKSTVTDTTRVGGGSGGGGDDENSTSGSDSDDDEIVFDEEDDRNESARRTKAALDAVVHRQGRTGSFWSSFFK